MVSRINKRQRAWLLVDQRHGDQLIELQMCARQVGPDGAFDLFLTQLYECSEDEVRAALHPIFQSGLLAAAEIEQRRKERRDLARRARG